MGLRGPGPEHLVAAPLGVAPCTIDVEGKGSVALEQEYLPHVVMCENGGAGYEALKAQAIAARSVAYYAAATSGSICDGPACQVYSCSIEPSDAAIAAVAATSRQYLVSHQTLTYGFYVAGDAAVGAATSCVGSSGSTEKYVTYNAGKSGDAVEQTTLGFIFDPGESGYGQNRGCMSQWGARCLDDVLDLDHVEILRWFYGADIEVVTAPEDCDLVGEEGGEGGDEGIPPEEADDEGSTEAGTGDLDDGGLDSDGGQSDGDGVDCGKPRGDEEHCGDTTTGNEGGSTGEAPGQTDSAGEDPGGWGFDHARGTQGCESRIARRDAPELGSCPLWLLLPLALSAAARRRRRTRPWPAGEVS